MGMYDYIKYNKKEKMPDGFDATGKSFQTYDLIHKNMAGFEITKDNKLFSNGKDMFFHGEIDICISGDDKIFRDYRVKFTDGILQSIIVLNS